MTKNSRSLSRRDLLAGVGSVGLSTLAGCSALAQTPPGPHLRIGTLQPPVTLDPIEAKYVGSKQAINRVFDGLYTYGEGTDIVPQIATGQPAVSDNGRRIDVTIDEQAHFQNDQPITSEDVQYSFEAPVEEGAPSAWRVDMIDSVEIVDDWIGAARLPIDREELRSLFERDHDQLNNRSGEAQAPIQQFGPMHYKDVIAFLEATCADGGSYEQQPSEAVGQAYRTYVIPRLLNTASYEQMKRIRDHYESLNTEFDFDLSPAIELIDRRQQNARQQLGINE